jgi:hypothetical protein
VALAERMLELNKEKHGVGAGLKPAPTAEIEREIAATDGEIDQLV